MNKPRPFHSFVAAWLALALSAACSQPARKTQAAPPSSNSPRSALPVPARLGAATAPNLAQPFRVLDWAGFEAAVTYSFDDGFASHLGTYPALQSLGVRYTFYPSVSPNATNPTWGQVVKDGHELGNHTVHHCTAGGQRCKWGYSLGSAEAELDAADAFLKQRLGLARTFSAATPYGDVGYAAALRARFCLNRGMEEGFISANDSTDPLDLPALAPTQGGDLDRAVDAMRAAGKWQIFVLHSLADEGDYRPLPAADLLANITRTRDSHDVWIDSLVNVGSYWLGQKLMQSAQAVTAGSSQTWSWELPPCFPSGKYLRVTIERGQLAQNGTPLRRLAPGFFEVALDARSLTWTP